MPILPNVALTPSGTTVTSGWTPEMLEFNFPDLTPETPGLPDTESNEPLDREIEPCGMEREIGILTKDQEQSI